jgi:hypothetical protein
VIADEGPLDRQERGPADRIRLSSKPECDDYRNYADALGYKFGYFQTVTLFLLGCTVVGYNLWKRKFCVEGCLSGVVYGLGILLGGWLILIAAPSLFR